MPKLSHGADFDLVVSSFGGLVGDDGRAGDPPSVSVALPTPPDDVFVELSVVASFQGVLGPNGQGEGEVGGEGHGEGGVGGRRETRRDKEA